MNILSKYILMQIIDFALTTVDTTYSCLNNVEEISVDILQEEKKEDNLFIISFDSKNTDKL